MPPPPRRSSHEVIQPRTREIEDEFGILVVPVWPSDLPRLDMTDGGFKWTREELDEACHWARQQLFK